MRKGILRLGALAVAFVALSAFDDHAPLPPDYSPNYSYIDVVTPNGRVKRVLVPDACMTEAEEPLVGIGEERMLPPGCANAFNLQRMVARKKDLVQGRRMGRAPMATTARAASKYLEGPDAENRKDPTSSFQPSTAPTTPVQ